MKGVYTKTRSDWIAHLLGQGRNFTEKQMERAIGRLGERGWGTAFPAYGPAYERLAVVRHTHSLTAIVRNYKDGTRLFDRAAIEQALNSSLHTITGACRLA